MGSPIGRILVFVLACAGLLRVAAAQELFDQGVVRDFHFTFKQANWWNLVLNTRSSGADIKADLRVDNVTYPDVGFRIKGASSSSVRSDKRPFNLTMDSFVPGQSLYGFETLNLNNGAYDPTLTREVISYEIFRDYIPTPRTNYVRVHLNNTFWGVYILIEQPNKDLLRTWFQDSDGVRFKGDRPSGAAVETSTLVYLGSTPSAYQQNYELKTTGDPTAWGKLVTMIDRLNNLPNATFEQEIVKYINVDRALWYFACNNLVVNSDDYMGAGHNYYMYFDPRTGQMNMLPWDLNEAFGVHGPSTNPWTYPITYRSTWASRPLLRRILAVPKWRSVYFAHYRHLRDRFMDWAGVIGPMNKRHQDRIRADVMREPNYLFNMRYFDPSFAGRIFFNGHYIHGLKEVVEGRKAFLNARNVLNRDEPHLSDARFSTAMVRPGQRVQVRVKVVPESASSPAIQRVVVRSSSTGIFVEDPMFDDGKHGDGAAGDGVYGGSFAARQPGVPTRFYFHATDASGIVQLLPVGAEHQFFSVPVGFSASTSDLVINEFVADNDTGDRDAAGEFEDWIELFNRGSSPFDASGYYLSDSALNPKQWRIPAATVIPAGGFLRIWCDDQPAQGPLHATFKLSKSGESVVLTDKDANNNALLDGVTYGQQKSDRAFGRVPDGGDHRFYIWTPSGGGPITGVGPGPSANDKVRFDHRRTAAPSGMDLLASGSAKGGNLLSLTIQDGPPNTGAFLAIGLGVRPIPLGASGQLYLDPAVMVFTTVSLNGQGVGGISGTVPSLPGGATVYFQGATTAEFSNGVIIRLSR